MVRELQRRSGARQQVPAGDRSSSATGEPRSLGHVCSQPLPGHLMRGWHAQLVQHSVGAAEPVWVGRDGLRPGTLSGDTFAHICSHELGVPTANITGIETWAQRRKVGSPMHLHWDMFGTAPQDHDDSDDGEEPSMLPPHRRMNLPLLSCVVYTGNVGGPTLVLDHRPGEDWDETVHCRVCWPTAGRVLTFPGDLLHGTLVEEAAPEAAAKAAPQAAAEAAAETRVTLILNLWEKPPAALLELEVTEELPASCEDVDTDSSGSESRESDDSSDSAVRGKDQNFASGRQQQFGESTTQHSGRQPVRQDVGRAKSGGGEHKHKRQRATSVVAASVDEAVRAGWKWHSLLMGMRDETTCVELCMPPVRYNGLLCEDFTAWVRHAGDQRVTWGKTDVT